MTKYSIMILATLALSSCNKNPPDPVGEPFRIELRPTQSATSSTEANLAALVDYGGFGFVSSTVEFSNDATILATTSDRKILEATNQNPWDASFQKTVTLQPNTDYNLSAKVTWTSPKGGTKSLTSAVVKFRLANP